MNDHKIILAGTLLVAATEPVLKDRLIRDPRRPHRERRAHAGRAAGDIRRSARHRRARQGRDPGLVNAHCHHTEALQRSLRDRVPFELWLPERRGIEDILDPGYDELLAANHIALLENLKHGTTTVLHHLSRRGAIDLEEIRACIDAAERIGVRTFIAPSIADAGWHRVVPERKASAEALEELRRLEQALDLSPADRPPSTAWSRPARRTPARTTS